MATPISINQEIFYEVYDNVATTVYSQFVPVNTAGLIQAMVQVGRVSTADHRTFWKSVPFTRGGGALSVGTTTDLFTPVGSGGSAGWTVTFSAASNNFIVQITGQNLGTTSWYITLKGIAIQE